MIYITGTATTPVGRCAGIRLTVNSTVASQVITVADADGTKAIISSPIVGNTFTYFGFNGPVTVTCGLAGDVTVSVLSAQRA